MKSRIDLLTLLLPLFRGILGTAVYTNWMYSLSSDLSLGPIPVFEHSLQLYDCSNPSSSANPATNSSAFLLQLPASPVATAITLCTSLPNHSTLLPSLLSPPTFCNFSRSADCQLIFPNSFLKKSRKSHCCIKTEEWNIGEWWTRTQVSMDFAFSEEEGSLWASFLTSTHKPVKKKKKRKVNILKHP